MRQLHGIHCRHNLKQYILSAGSSNTTLMLILNAQACNAFDTLDEPLSYETCNHQERAHKPIRS